MAARRSSDPEHVSSVLLRVVESIGVRTVKGHDTKHCDCDDDNCQCLTREAGEAERR